MFSSCPFLGHGVNLWKASPLSPSHRSIWGRFNSERPDIFQSLEQKARYDNLNKSLFKWWEISLKVKKEIIWNVNLDLLLEIFSGLRRNKSYFCGSCFALYHHNLTLLLVLLRLASTHTWPIRCSGDLELHLSEGCWKFFVALRNSSCLAWHCVGCSNNVGKDHRIIRMPLSPRPDLYI